MLVNKYSICSNNCDSHLPVVNGGVSISLVNDVFALVDSNDGGRVEVSFAASMGGETKKPLRRLLKEVCW